MQTAPDMHSTPSAEPAPLTYHHDEINAVHEFKFHESTPRAVNVWLDHMERIYADISTDAQVRLWMDITESGSLPVSYAMNKTYRWMSKLDVHPNARMVFVHKPDMLMYLADQLFRTLRLNHLQTRFFTADHSEAARAWLVER